MIDLLDPTFLNSIFRFVTPILLAALGGLICERVGVFNIALEGMMLVGAFGAIAGSYYAQSAAMGVLAAMMAGGVTALLFALLIIRFQADMIVIGIAVNLLVAGVTVFLLRVLFGARGAFQDPKIQGLDHYTLPLLEGVPLLGPLVSGHTGLVYLSWGFVISIYLLLFRHPWGLRMRGVGEKPEAAETLGVPIAQVRSMTILVSGMFCGLGGAQLALGNVTLFVENMSAGRGWMAVVTVMLGQAHPVGVFSASTLFGFVDSLSLRIQGLGLPQQFTDMFPYLVTLLSLFVIRLRR